METVTGCPDSVVPYMLENKYRDIADGNDNTSFFCGVGCDGLETKYRDIADGNP